MPKISIKKIKRLAEEEKPKAIARYLRKFLPPEKRKPLEQQLDTFSNKLIEEEFSYTKRDIINKIEEMKK